MTRIVVFGGGQQGRVIAGELARRHEVTVADVRPLSIPDVRCVQADLADAGTVERLAAEHDLAVGALPARLGYNAARAAIAAHRSYVDVAFFAEDTAALDVEARAAGVAVLPDCGLAPGLSHLIAGRALVERPRRSIVIYVGGVAEDPSRPYGYVCTWALEDLLDSYRRPARIRSGGKVVAVPAMSGMERLTIDGVGEMEAFFTDGARTLLELDGVLDLSEKTLRWPGHAAAVKPLVANGTFVQELETRCREGGDMVVFQVRADDEIVTMVDRAQGGMSAMARTTALTAAVFADWVARGGVEGTGVVPPERLARDPRAYRFILDGIAGHGIQMRPALPFLT